MPASAFNRYRGAMGGWLLVICGMTFAMVVIGGLTRLTHSGLSMVEWRPLMGALPPIGDQAWVETFNKYQQFPEYQKVNHQMTLTQFKSIFWFEYGHRLLGRLIGLAFLGPLLFFLARRAVPRQLAPKLVGLFFLGGLQGLIGWWMVKSGLVDRPDVSHFRLTVHLGAAFALMAALWWLALDLLKPKAQTRPIPGTAGLANLSLGLWAGAFITVLSGGLVAGLNAGFVFNTFPLMGGRVAPASFFALSPWWTNFFENHGAVQFDHRVLALSVMAVVIGLWLAARSRPITRRARVALHTVLAVVLGQVTLGIATLLSVVATPLASAHQAGALVLFLALGWATHELKRPVGPQA